MDPQQGEKLTMPTQVEVSQFLDYLKYTLSD